ncbi:hypothetical protein [Corynebacterium sp. H113]|uniref:hypothetical protein n=1 Tax=Corynebacterium sp. H113 TaxID=3133419 RepID=UPI00309BD8DB
MNAQKKKTGSTASSHVSMSAPRSVMAGAWIAVVESTLGIGYGIFLAVRDMMGFEDRDAVISGIGTALWFFIVFGAVLAGAIMLIRGHRWGRGPIIMLNLCLLGVAYYMFKSDAYTLAVPVVIAAIAALYAMFNSQALNWAANEYGR